jgi:predicted enzyme related to lactoylglutathione lyase
VIDVQRTDFVAVPTQDRERAVAFYGETLGLTKNPSSTDTWIEFETGNLTLSLVVPEEVGIEFAPLPFGTIMLRVPDVESAKAKLQEAGVEFLGETWDSGVCHGAVLGIPTATASASITVTRLISTGAHPDGGHARRLHPRPGGRHRCREALLR